MASASALRAVNAAEIAERIFKLCEQFPNGINDTILSSNLPDIDVNGQLSGLTRLVNQKRIELLSKDGKPVYKVKDKSKPDVDLGDNEEMVVYELIKEAGDKGIWNRDIRYKSNLQMTEVTKVLKKLEVKKLIKSVKSVAAPKKKVYLLANLEPDRSITGGAFYSNGEFETELAELANEMCHKFLRAKEDDAVAKTENPMERYHLSSASSVEIQTHINRMGIFAVTFSQADIERVMNTLVYDGKVEKRKESSADGIVKMYRCIRSMVKSTGLTRVPCGVCPHIRECRVGGIITPLTCPYIKKWLNGEEF